MNFKENAKRLARAPFRAIGLDVVRWVPQPEVGVSAEMDACFRPQYRPDEHWLAKAGIRTVLDVGAHVGEFAGRIAAILPGAGLICFEPLEESFSELERRFSRLPNFRAIRCALGDTTGTFPIHRNEYAPSSSMLPMTALHKSAFTFAQEQKTESVTVRRLTEVAQELSFQGPLLIKLDVQGFEARVITGGEDVVARAKVMIVETSFEQLYEGAPLFDDIYEMLKARGFSYAGNFEQLLSPTDGRVLQVDAIFTR